MGVDIHGSAPESKAGEYVGFSWWTWRPLWELCEAVAPEVTEAVRYAGSNDGDGLNGHRSKVLGSALDDALRDGRAMAHVEERNARLDALPDEACYVCGGSGTRPGGLEEFGAEWVARCNGCNGCSGTGKRRPAETHYRFDLEDVEALAAFLRACGGFEIW